MELSTTLCACFSVFVLILAFIVSFSRPKLKKFPPSPPALPVIGHLHLLKEPLYRTLRAFAEKYGPIYSLRVGSRFMLVVSSTSGVEECLNQNDVIFANRPIMTIGDYLGYNHSLMTLASYGDHWRNLRRICALGVFSLKRLNKSFTIRRDEINHLIHKLYKVSSNEFAKVDLKSISSEFNFSVIMRMLTGKRYYGEDVNGGVKFRNIIEEVAELSGAAFPGDYISILKWVDFTGNLKKMKRVGKEIDIILQALIDEQRRKMSDPETANSMVSHLLSLQESQPEYYTDELIKGLVEVMIIGGTDTSAVTLEWAMANLLNHPNILQKARDEIDSQIGTHQMIDEEKLANLPYLRNIISETLRLYPPAPLLGPHRSSSECTIGGYDIPRDTTLLVNVWSIQRDPKYWDDATRFKPERFESLQSNEGQAFKMLPFGAGRRSCPGVALANRVLGLALGSLIQCFEWKRVDDKEIDMAEGKGLIMPKAEPLVAMCKARSISSKLLLNPVIKD